MLLCNRSKISKLHSTKLCISCMYFFSKLFHAQGEIKNMKKAILALSSLAMIAAPIAAVVSCGDKKHTNAAKPEVTAPNTSNTGTTTETKTDAQAETHTETHTPTAQQNTGTSQAPSHATMAMRDIPAESASYYVQNELANKKGEALFDALHTIQTRHTGSISRHGYNGLYDVYKDAFKDTMFENDGSLVDIYSENPNGADPYNYNAADHGGSYHGEGDMYNREHIVPQSSFDKRPPMHDDPHQVWPTDGKVNGVRSNYPHGEVTHTTKTSQNGSKLGTNANGETVFEPIDAFKGDVARAYLYFQLTYHGQSHFSVFQNSFPYMSQDFLQMLIRWNNADPIDAFDIQRNEVIGRIYGLRNPFVDYPTLITSIFDANGQNLDASKVLSTQGVHVNITPEHHSTGVQQPAPHHTSGSTSQHPSTSGTSQHHSTSGTSQHHSTSGTSQHSSTSVAHPAISTTAVAEPATYATNLQVPSGYTAPDVSTWGTVWMATYNPKTSSFEKKFSGSSYNDILDQILAHFKGLPATGKTPKYAGLLRRNSAGKWAIWDIPGDLSSGHSNTDAKLTELGLPTGDRSGGQYCWDSADDAIAYIKGLSNDLKAKIFNTLT